jgi:hypothetical protein
MRSALRPGWLLLLSAFGCAFGTGTLEEVDPAAIPERPTYAEHIQPMMDFYCAACHDPEGQVGAIEGLDVTSYEAVVDDFDEIAESVFEEHSMPPAGARQLSSLDEAILERWAAQEFPP